MLIGLAVLAAAALLALSLVLADRSAASRAELRASAAVSVALRCPSQVRVLDRPFLGQAARGRYRRVSVSGGGMPVGEMTGATLDARLTNAYVPVRRLLTRSVREVACEAVEGHVVLPYGELARVAPIPGLRLRQRGAQLLASAAVPVPGLDQIARISGEAVWQVGGDTVWLRIRGVSVVGIALPAVLLEQLLPALHVPVPLPELPFGLRIHDLLPTAAGLQVHARARAVTFGARPAGGALEDRPGWRDERPGG